MVVARETSVTTTEEEWEKQMPKEFWKVVLVVVVVVDWPRRRLWAEEVDYYSLWYHHFVAQHETLELEVYWVMAAFWRRHSW